MIIPTRFLPQNYNRFAGTTSAPTPTPTPTPVQEGPLSVVAPTSPIQSQPIDWSKIKTGTDLASLYYSNFMPKDASSLVKDGRVSLDDLNNSYNTLVNYTGSGRQGSAQFYLDNLWFDPETLSVALAPDLARYDNIFDPDSLEGLPYDLSSNVTKTSSRSGGFDFYNPMPTIDIDGINIENDPRGTWDPKTKSFIPHDTGGLVGWGELTEDQKLQIAQSGLFPNIQNVDFANRKDDQYKWAGVDDIDRSSGSIDANDLGAFMQGMFKLENEGLRNTAQDQTDGWLGRNIGSVGLALGSMLVPGLGGQFLGTAGKVMGAGQAVSSGNPLGIALGGLALYNSAAGLANAATGSTAYSQFSPSSYISNGLKGAGITGLANQTLTGGLYGGLTSALGGQDAMTGALTGAAQSAIPSQFRGVASPLIRQLLTKR